MKRISTYMWGLVAIVLLMPGVLFAQGGGTGGSPGSGGGGTGGGAEIGKLQNPIKADNITDFITKGIKDIIMPVGTIFVVLAVIYCGFLFVRAQGNAAKLKEAKDALMWTLIGGAILLGAWVLAQALADTVGQLKG